MLSITLHIKLLKVGAEALKILVIGEYRDRLSSEEIVIPDTNQTQ